MTYNISPIDAAPLMADNQKAGEQTVHLLHCWGGMVTSGEYLPFARQFYPLIVKTVIRLLAEHRAIV